MERNPENTIDPSDKGGAVVVLNTEYYPNAAKRRTTSQDRMLLLMSGAEAETKTQQEGPEGPVVTYNVLHYTSLVVVQP